MSFFMFGNAYIRDKPTSITLELKSNLARIQYVLDEDHGVMLNPGEPVAYCSSFHAPGEALDQDKHVRILEIIPWEQIKSIVLEYPTVENTDPATWEFVKKPVSAPIAH